MTDALQPNLNMDVDQRDVCDNADSRHEEEMGDLAPDNGDEAREGLPAVTSDQPVLQKLDQLTEEVRGARSDLQGLSDVFVRRLLDDRQKADLIRSLEECASFAVIEPFISDLILLLDRVEKIEDDFSKSVAEELLDILARRNVKRIEVGRTFDSKLHKAISVLKKPTATRTEVIGVSRCGYVFGEKVIRPAEVVVQMPPRTPQTKKSEAEVTE